ncbi:MAG: cyclase family protein [Halanaeroarchaeum sp.]
MADWIDLTQDVHPEMERMEFLPCPEIVHLSEQSETSLQITELSLAVHVGTHMDAPVHAIDGGRSIDEFPPSKWHTDATVVDVDVGPESEIGLEAVRSAGDRLEPGDALVVRTGWQDHLGTDTYAEHPYFGRDLAEWIVDRDLAFVGMDFLTPDMPPDLRPAGFTYPIHTTLLDAEVLIVENLANVSALPETFTLVAAPLPIRGADASPVRAFARPR